MYGTRVEKDLRGDGCLLFRSKKRIRPEMNVKVGVEPNRTKREVVVLSGRLRSSSGVTNVRGTLTSTRRETTEFEVMWKEVVGRSRRTRNS